MEDLLQPQIRQNCQLALPEGLKDLMSDISREVLRAQPKHFCQFITDYLSALLVARENLTVAARVCDNVCKSHCYPELEDELRALGLSDEDVAKTVDVVSEYFESDEVKESNLLLKLLRKTNVTDTQLPEVLAAVQGAFLRHQVNNTVIYESSSTSSDMDEASIAAKHTLKLYRKTKAPTENYDNVVGKIQAAYRAYGVRRKFQRVVKDHPPTTKKTTEKSLRFESKMEQLFPESTRTKRCYSKASSLSLAGSFVTLPPYRPYSIDEHSDIIEIDEVTEKEKEHTNFDYTSDDAGTSANQEAEIKKTPVKSSVDLVKKPSIRDLSQIWDAGYQNVMHEVAEDVLEEVEEKELMSQVVEFENENIDRDIDEIEDMEETADENGDSEFDVMIHEVDGIESTVDNSSVESLDDDTVSSVESFN